MQLLWRLMKPYTLTKLLFDLKVIEKRPLQIAEDNAACIAQANNGIRHVRNAKHYEVKLAFLQQLVADEVIQFVYCPTNHQVADFFTKPWQKISLFISEISAKLILTDSFLAISFESCRES